MRQLNEFFEDQPKNNGNITVEVINKWFIENLPKLSGIINKPGQIELLKNITKSSSQLVNVINDQSGGNFNFDELRSHLVHDILHFLYSRKAEFEDVNSYSLVDYLEELDILIIEWHLMQYLGHEDYPDEEFIGENIKMILSYIYLMALLEADGDVRKIPNILEKYVVNNAYKLKDILYDYLWYKAKYVERVAPDSYVVYSYNDGRPFLSDDGYNFDGSISGYVEQEVDISIDNSMSGIYDIYQYTISHHIHNLVINSLQKVIGLPSTDNSIVFTGFLVYYYNEETNKFSHQWIDDSYYDKQIPLSMGEFLYKNYADVLIPLAKEKSINIEYDNNIFDVDKSVYLLMEHFDTDEIYFILNKDDNSEYEVRNLYTSDSDLEEELEAIIENNLDNFGLSYDIREIIENDLSNGYLKYRPSYEDLIKKAKSGDESAIQVLRAFFRVRRNIGIQDAFDFTNSYQVSEADTFKPFTKEGEVLVNFLKEMITFLNQSIENYKQNDEINNPKKLIDIIDNITALSNNSIFPSTKQSMDTVSLLMYPAIIVTKSGNVTIASKNMKLRYDHHNANRIISNIEYFQTKILKLIEQFKSLSPKELENIKTTLLSGKNIGGELDSDAVYIIFLIIEYLSKIDINTIKQKFENALKTIENAKNDVGGEKLPDGSIIYRTKGF